MINTQLHNQLIDLEIQRREHEAKKRIQEVKTEMLKERLRQALYVVGFLFVVLLLTVLLLRLSPNRTINCPIQNSINQKQKNYSQIKRNDTKKKKFNGIEYVKKNNYIYKRVYKDGVVVQEIKLAPTIEQSKEQNHEKIPQFSVPKKKDISR